MRQAILVTAAAMMMSLAGCEEETGDRVSGDPGMTSQKASETVRAEADDEGTRELPDESLPRMVELYSSGCGACKRMEPVVDGLVRQCDKKGVLVETVDVSKEENESLMEHYRVRAVPTFLFLDEYGMEVARLVGGQTEQSLKQALSVLRGEQCPGMSLVGKDASGSDGIGG